MGKIIFSVFVVLLILWAILANIVVALTLWMPISKEEIKDFKNSLDLE